MLFNNSTVGIRATVLLSIANCRITNVRICLRSADPTSLHYITWGTTLYWAFKVNMRDSVY